MLKLNNDFGNKKEIKGVNGELSLQLPSRHYDKAGELPESERADYYKGLTLEDYKTENEMTLVVTLDKKNAKDKSEKPELIFHKVECNETYDTAFANPKNKILVVVDYEEQEGIKGKVLTGMEQR